MVCVSHEQRCECIVRDTARNLEKYEVTLPATTPVNELIKLVADKMMYEPSSFQLTLQVVDDEAKILTEETTGSLESVGLRTEGRNSFLLEGMGGQVKNLVAKPSAGGGAGGGGGGGAEEGRREMIPAPPPPPGELINPIRPLRPSNNSPSAEYTFPAPTSRHETGYVGLVNQAMTCYLNSLLQALYMTPEFRNALYKWQFEPSHQSSGPAKSIPFQLQKLFLNLQTSSKTAVETTELTKSFGWESGEVWQQHDIQELCRVMFDALEQEFKETQQADLINQLYQGKMTDYVKCLECGTVKSREDTFLDIPLPVRPFGSNVAYGSVQEALRGFVQPETLDGNNQYLCEKCGKKCDAHKGLKFTKFPYLLTLHLKRFDFDYNTMHRIKLNDKLVFPDILDLNSFVTGGEGETTAGGGTETEADSGGTPSPRNDDSSIADSVLDEESSNAAPPDTQNNEVDQEEDEGIDMTVTNNRSSGGEPAEKARPRGPPSNSGAYGGGPFLYELYSIMIHSGSASGGHYYAYIKDFAKNEWFCFNDQTVSSITVDDIKKTYGGGGGSRGYYSGAYSSSTNAYMLMYRQINKELNRAAILEAEFPPHIKRLLTELKEAEEQEKAIRAKQEEMVRLKVHANHPLLGHQPRSTKLFCSQDMPLKEVKALAYSNLELKNIIPEEQCRLVIYNKSQEEMKESLDGRDADLVGDIFKNKYMGNPELFMEIREKNAKFLPYNIGDVRLSVYLYDIERREVEGGPYEIRTSPCQTLSDLKKLLADYLDLEPLPLHCVLLRRNSLEYLSKESLPLNKLCITSGSSHRVFISYKKDDIDISEKFQESKLYKLLDDVKNIITVHIIVPDTKKETLETLLIPPLVDESQNEEEKPSDSTPTGESVPLTNGLLSGDDELGGYGSGGAGTSDQSASEDSSLTDSDRTIMGEDVNECPFSSPSEQDLQLTMSDSQTFGKDVNECPFSSPSEQDLQLTMSDSQTFGKVNGESVWVEEDSGVSTESYFKATPYLSDDGQKMLKVIVDRTIINCVLLKNLEKYVGVESKYLKLMKDAGEGQEISCTLRTLKDDSRVSLKLERVLSPDENKISLVHLAPNSTPPTRHLFNWIVSRGESIANLKKTLLKEAEKRAQLTIPYERCRLRRESGKGPGRVLQDTENWAEGEEGGASSGYGSSLSPATLYLEELLAAAGGAEEEAAAAAGAVLVYVRRWTPSDLSLAPFQELTLHLNTDFSLSQKLSEISGIPVENVKFAQSKKCFPGESGAEVSDLYWETDHDSKYSLNDWEKDNMAIIFYRDDREEIKRVVRREDEVSSAGGGAAPAGGGGTSVSSYLSPRREKALKIYIERTKQTNTSPAAAPIDID